MKNAMYIRRPRFLCMLLTLLTLVSSLSVFAIPAYASEPAILVGPDYRYCVGNLDNCSFPNGITSATQGEKIYLNLAASTHYKIDEARFYIKKPDSNQFNLVGKYDPSGWFRYAWVEYTFKNSGTYGWRVEITLTNGVTGYCESSIYVAPKQTSSVTNDDSDIEFNWDSKGKTSSSRNASDAFTINGTEITPGTIHKTYFSNGTESTAGNAYYCMYNDKLTYVAGAQCLSYVYKCQLLLYGADSHTTTLYNQEKDDGISKFYGVRYNKNMTADEYKTLIIYTGEGTHLRVGSSHSIFVLKADENGFYYTDANTSSSTYGKNNIKIGYYTYTDFANGSYGYLNYVEYYHG